jgi:hypothetical protein
MTPHRRRAQQPITEPPMSTALALVVVGLTLLLFWTLWLAFDQPPPL